MPMPEPMGGGRAGSAAPPPGRHPRARSRFGRLLILVGFLLGAAALIFGVASALRNQTKADPLKNTVQAPAETILTRSAVAPEPAAERLPGRAKACRVVLRWNMEENPDMPYLEAIKLKRLDWNP